MTRKTEGGPGNRGVYFLANDAVAEPVIGFLNSFRTHNPAIPLCFVPFADDHDRIARLADRCDFTIWADDAVLRRCDAISRAFHDGVTMGQYRKLALWQGPFDEFLYIDSDTIVLDSVDFVFRYLDRFDFLTSHSNIPRIRHWVWRDSVYDTGELRPEQIEYAASTGFVASRRGLIDPAEVERDLAAPLRLAPHMELLCREQPLLNYLIVTSGRPYSSLWSIAAETDDPDIPQEQWAGHDIGRVESGRLIPSQVNRVLLVHWAGEWLRARTEGGQIPYHDLWRHYREMNGLGNPAGTGEAADREVATP
ncbi:hypothetical protein GCM10022225_14250 [Plantactinospora mayteni]|uniref:Uncharacterized protein n=1 Tax=Plantactinospora mayteni TaxID=566021 RepID=A0ABQ4EFR6_9ACTN|nr:hypothetical protein [Plantactinospora mayteni]GIG93500.1 hypothetical protein Pma05_00730 [Plantactinospora mayteni]